MAAGPTILVVEDEQEIRRFLRTSLAAEGYGVVEAVTARRGLIDAASHKPDLVILDLGLPDFDGLEVIAKIRAWSALPIIVLSARLDEQAKIDALDAGANDYITKPFGVRELFARVRSALRHFTSPAMTDGVLRFQNATIDLVQRKATRHGEELRLTPIEFKLVACLAKNLGMVVTHRQLLTQVWGPVHERDTHYLRIYMKQLRDKLELDPVNPQHFLTETGVGYRLVVNDGFNGVRHIDVKDQRYLTPLIPVNHIFHAAMQHRAPYPLCFDHRKSLDYTLQRYPAKHQSKPIEMGVAHLSLEETTCTNSPQRGVRGVRSPLP
jgi:two-component system KDP operon response regulator KdpE